ncbi:MAG: DUF305 domain-containing protein [Ilumatobacteraceae bacterium]
MNRSGHEQPATRGAQPGDEHDTDEHDTDDVEQVVSDEAMAGLVKWGLIGLGVILLIVGVAALADWLGEANTVEAEFGPVEIGFLQDMIDHHEQALLISNTYLENNPDGDAASYARDVVLFQTRDIGRMEQWLDEGGSRRGDPGREAMTWMGMSTPVGEMDGMATPEQIDALAAARGAEADALFFDLMSTHHLGGVHMADSAAANTNVDWLATFAEAVSYGQQIEVVEYDQARERFGLPPRAATGG